MYVKLGFSVAAHLDSEIMIMDEVLAVGDMKFQQKCLNTMGDAANNQKRTILYVSHNMATIRNLCSRCIVLSKGKIVFDGDVDEAIAIYMENAEISDTFLDFRKIERTNQENGLIMFNSFKIPDRETPQYKYGEKMNFKVSIKSFIDAKNISIRLTLFYMDNTPISTIYTKGIIDIKKDEEKEIELCADISSLAPGKYYADIILWEFNDSAAHIRYDSIKGMIKFIVTADTSFNHGFEWGHRVWGHVVLPEIEIKSEGEIFEE